MKPRRLQRETSFSRTSGGTSAGKEVKGKWKKRGPRGIGKRMPSFVLSYFAHSPVHSHFPPPSRFPLALPLLPQPSPSSPSSRIQLRAQLGLLRRPLPENPRHDLVSVIAPILDEHLVGIETGNHHAGYEEAGHRGLQRRRIVPGDTGRRIDRHAHVAQIGRASCRERGGI